jgi:hypothetical protein
MRKLDLSNESSTRLGPEKDVERFAASGRSTALLITSATWTSVHESSAQVGDHS